MMAAILNVPILRPLTRRLGDTALAMRAGLSRRDLRAIAASELFDERFYVTTYPDIVESGLNPFEHFIVRGRFENRKPSAIFNPIAYAEANPEVATSDLEPFLHYVLIGQAAGAPLSNDFAKRVGLSQNILSAVAASAVFDKRYYLMTYPDVAASGLDPFEHYLAFGRFENRKASAIFDSIAYAEANPEVASSGLEPFLHYVLVGQAAGAPLSKAETIPPRPELAREIAPGTKRLIVFLTPGFEARTGGVLSIASIYRETEELTELHRAKVALCAVPGDDPLFLKYNWFENNNYFLDLNGLLRRCAQLDYLQLHIPEYAVNRVAQWLNDVSSSLLRNVREVHLNIMLQNIDLIAGQNVGELKRYGRVTATTGHEAYSNPATRQSLGVTVHRLSVFGGPQFYKRTAYPEKEPILVVSHDSHPLKDEVLGRIARAFPQLDIRIVRDLTFEQYKVLILRAKWALTFGEGLDGYFAETIFSGGNSFAVFNDRFFTSDFAALETVYPSWEILMERMPIDLQRLDEPVAYERCWRQAYDLLDSLYNPDQFRKNLRAFYREEYTFP